VAAVLKPNGASAPSGENTMNFIQEILAAATIAAILAFPALLVWFIL
jgi:hypothetical protein